MKEILKDLKSSLPIFFLFSAILFNFIIWGALANQLWNLNATLLSGIIAFWGAIIGGGLAYRGIIVQLKHRNREIFFESATERLGNLETIIYKVRGHLNGIFIIENMVPNKSINKFKSMENLISDLLKEIASHKNELFKTMTYDEMKIIRFKEISLNSNLNKGITEDNLEDAITKARDIIDIFIKSRENLEKKYYRLKDIHSQYEE